MVVFHSDLDNTLIYSYKHDIGDRKRNVERYQGRDISFITERTYELLREAREKVLFVPTTTRTNEQYGRIGLGIGDVAYALTCNGGILLAGGQEDRGWYEESLELASGCEREFLRAWDYLQGEPARTLEIRNIRDLFLFTKCGEPARVVEELKSILDIEKVDVFSGGDKIYVLPRKLSKGDAVRRFRKYIRADVVLAAGDSEFDVPMLREADFAWAPKSLADKYMAGENVVAADGGRLFSECVLEGVLETAAAIPGFGRIAKGPSAV